MRTERSTRGLTKPAPPITWDMLAAIEQMLLDLGKETVVHWTTTGAFDIVRLEMALIAPFLWILCTGCLRFSDLQRARPDTLRALPDLSGRQLLGYQNRATRVLLSGFRNIGIGATLDRLDPRYLHLWATFWLSRRRLISTDTTESRDRSATSRLCTR